MDTELAKNAILKMIEEAGSEGVTEGQIASELVLNHKINYSDALDLIKSTYRAVGAEQYKETITRYCMPVKEKKEPTAVILARESVKRSSGEIDRKIIDSYRTKKAR